MTQLKNLLDLEQVAIQKAQSQGHKNPRECLKHQACLYASGADRKILDYKMVKISDILDDNIRVEDVDTRYCREELGPLIQRKFEDEPSSLGLRYPLLVTQRAGRYKLIHGHNRKWCILNILRKNEVPVFIEE